jgi:hypothetical protein
MPSSPSTRQPIPQWLIITLSILVIVALYVLYVAMRGEHVTESTTTTTHTYNKQGDPVKTEAVTTQDPTSWDALGLLVIPVLGGAIVAIISNRYNKNKGSVRKLFKPCARRMRHYRNTSTK